MARWEDHDTITADRRELRDAINRMSLSAQARVRSVIDVWDINLCQDPVWLRDGMSNQHLLSIANALGTAGGRPAREGERAHRPAPGAASMTERDDGLTEAEGRVMDNLIDAANTFGQLDRDHPDELRDFVDGIHRCQYLLGVRVVRRDFPEGWPVKV